MNQFKKAKQLKNETGQTIESITDLKTAGVSQKSNNSESSVTTVIATQTSDNSIEIVDSPSDVLITPTQLVQNNTNTDSTITESIIVESKEQIIVPSESAPSSTIPSQDNVTPNTLSTNMSEVIKPNIIKSENTSEQENKDIIVSEIMSSNYSNQLEDRNTSSVVTVQPRNVSQQSQDTTVTKHSKSSKKSVPNIFSPKGEAKSMRKSLILKPSSVKIAEDYCVKNGGSFNELIQPLLDNFLNDYGL